MNVSKIYALAIIGSGHLAREVFELFAVISACPENELLEEVCFILKDGDSVSPIPNAVAISESEFIKDTHKAHRAIIAISDPKTRAAVASKFPEETVYATLVHPSAVISPSSTIGMGSIVCAGAIVSRDTRISDHAQINWHTSIGHDVEIDEFFTSAPGVRVSGNCQLGKEIYLGTNACVKQGLRIATRAVIGMGAVVLTNLEQEGTYVGTPAKLIKDRGNSRQE